MENASRSSQEPPIGGSGIPDAERGRSVPPAMPPIIIQQGGTGALKRILASVGWLGFAVCGVLLLGQYLALHDYFDTTGGLTEKHHSLSRFARDKVAIITVDGVIMSGEGFVKRQIDRVRRDANVKAVVLRVDSPGGTVAGADYIYHHLKKLREERKLPLVVSMGSVAASGGYYVAMAVGDQPRSIFAEPTTTTGSIGVIIPHYDLSGLLARFDVKDDSIASHPRKEMLSMTKPMSEDQRQLVQAYLDEAFQRFKKIVGEGRPKFRQDKAALDRLATGEIFTAQQAIQHGLVDEAGFIEEAIDRAIELAGLKKEQTRVVRFQSPLTIFGLEMFYSRDPSRASSGLEFLVPQAYYLWTSFPPLMSTYARLGGAK